MRSDGIRNVFKKIEKITERFEKGDFEEGSEPLSQVVCLRDQLRAVVVKTCADVETLEDRLKKLHELELLEFEEKTKNHYHALLSGAGYYSTASKAPEEVESLLREMVVYGVAPTNITFWVLLKALADSGKLDLALNYLERMEEEFSVKPESTHHGVVIDGFARTKDPQNLAFAVERVKQLVPFQGQEMSFNAILSRCYPPRYPTEEDLEWLVSVIPIAQDLINFLHGASYVYTVLESTHWRLKVRGIIWPKSVLTRPDDVLVGGKIQKKVRGIIWPKSVLTRPDDVLVGGKIQKKVRGIIWPKSVLTRPDDVLVGGKIQKKGGRAVREGG
ncbi:pentatricopeptide repeat-containing protein At1g77170, mitochondrial isoform X1 [Raphanus sativus]|uniref:Pentatricopeptide repeat-containing protein At1g77170, mitochondrial isoform X1 n=1 Tax=Raphanus sativus TaxID=3726 RepID=A0A9W3CK96_RAPSA|nr:pentatricopeptide repeat-containing protein At1g77170, mitochondrial isoform X1 [Raphanus sativus]